MMCDKVKINIMKALSFMITNHVRIFIFEIIIVEFLFKKLCEDWTVWAVGEN